VTCTGSAWRSSATRSSSTVARSTVGCATPSRPSAALHRLDRRLRYTVSTVGFLARGGDDTFGALPSARPVARGKDKLLREHVATWLRGRGAAPLGSPGDAFVDLWDLPLWRFAFEGGVDFSGIRYENTAGHIDPHLTNLAFQQLDINVDTSMRMNTRDHG
jgi:hypothetical protein